MSPPTSPTGAPSPPIVDAHCHAGLGDGLTGPWDTRAPLGPYLERAQRAGIHRTVVFAAFHSDYRLANRRVADIVARHQERLLGFAFVHPARDRGRIEDLVREAVVDFGFRGIKVHRHDGRISREICEAAARHGVPVLYDPMGEIGPVELVATEYPRVHFIIPHLGSFADDWRAQSWLVELLSRHRNLYADTSGVRRFDLLLRAVRRAGAHKLIFGSDGPWLHPAVELAKVHALELPPEEEAAVLGGTILRLLEPATQRRRESVSGGQRLNRAVLARTP